MAEHPYDNEPNIIRGTKLEDLKEIPSENPKEEPVVLDLNNYVFDFVHQAYFEGMKTRATYCYAYYSWEFDAWRAQMRAVRALLEDAPGLMISCHDLRIRKPKPVAMGVGVCNMSQPFLDRSGKSPKWKYDQFDRAKGRDYSLLRCHDALVKKEEEFGAPQRPKLPEKQSISVIKKPMPEKEHRDIYGTGKIDLDAPMGIDPKSGVDLDKLYAKSE